MPASLIELELHQTMTHLECKLRELAENISEEKFPAWVAPAYLDEQARLKAAGLFTQIDYVDGQIGNESIILPGLIGASPRVIQLAEEANSHKQTLRETLLKLKGQMLELTDAKGRTRKVEADQQLLTRMGHARLHRLQAWRQIPILPARPEAVWFAWSETKKVYRVDCKEARRRLLALGEDQPHIAWQLKRLATLPPTAPLAIVGRARPHARANLFWSDKHMEQIRASLPLLYPARPGESLPALTPINEDRQKRTKRSTRSDTQLQADPFLPSINAYAYLPERKAEPTQQIPLF